MKQRVGIKEDTARTRRGMERTCVRIQAFFREKTGKDFPEDPIEQLWGAIGAVFGSWMAEKAVTYRRVEKITGLLGTAVNVVQMVFGNTGDNSGTGVCFTRNPNSGEKFFYGDYLVNAQGEDVVAGIRTPVHLTEMKKIMPKVYGQLEKVREKLEKHFRDMQDMEFTVEDGTLYMLQTRTGKRTPSAAFRMAVDMANEKLITKEEAVMRIKPEDIERLFYPVIDTKLDKKSLEPEFWAPGSTPSRAPLLVRSSFLHTTLRSGLRGATRSFSFGAKPARKTWEAWPSPREFSPPQVARPVTPL